MNYPNMLRNWMALRCFRNRAVKRVGGKKSLLGNAFEYVRIISETTLKTITMIKTTEILGTRHVYRLRPVMCVSVIR